MASRSGWRVHRRQRQLPRQERREAGGGEADAVEAAIHVEEKRGEAEAAGRGELRLRPAELLAELRRRPCWVLRPPALSDSV